MYPVIRMAKEFWVNRHVAPIKLGEFHISRHMCWPWDLDLWLELNNGWTLTLYDLGRLVLAKRSGLLSLLKRQRWGMTMAGASVRYRRRVRMFERFDMYSRGLCWDDRFFYIEQSIWKKNGECAGHIVYRSAFVDKKGIINIGGKKQSAYNFAKNLNAKVKKIKLKKKDKVLLGLDTSMSINKLSKILHAKKN